MIWFIIVRLDSAPMKSRVCWSICDLGTDPSKISSNLSTRVNRSRRVSIVRRTALRLRYRQTGVSSLTVKGVPPSIIRRSAQRVIHGNAARLSQRDRHNAHGLMVMVGACSREHKQAAACESVTFFDGHGEPLVMQWSPRPLGVQNHRLNC